MRSAIWVIPVSSENSLQALHHKYQGYTLELSAAAAAAAEVEAAAVADSIVAVADSAVLGAAVALRSWLCCQVCHKQAVRSFACCLCKCGVRRSQLPCSSAKNTANYEDQKEAQRECGV